MRRLHRQTRHDRRLAEHALLRKLHEPKRCCLTRKQLRLLDTPFSEEFRSAADVPWPTEDIATVRAIGPGAGNFTLVYMAHAGHFVRVPLELRSHFASPPSRLHRTSHSWRRVSWIVGSATCRGSLPE